MSLTWAIGVFVLTIVFFTVFTWLAARLVGRVAGESAAQRFRDAETIIEHGRLPEAWERQLDRLDEDERPRALEAKRDELLRFFRTAPVFEDDAVRRELLRRLTSAMSRMETPGAGGAARKRRSELHSDPTSGGEGAEFNSDLRDYPLPGS